MIVRSVIAAAVLAVPSAAGARYYALQVNDFVAAYPVREVCQLSATSKTGRMLRCQDLSDNRPRTVTVEITLTRVKVFANFRGRKVLRYSVVRR